MFFDGENSSADRSIVTDDVLRVFLACKKAQTEIKRKKKSDADADDARNGCTSVRTDNNKTHGHKHFFFYFSIIFFSRVQQHVLSYGSSNK